MSYITIILAIVSFYYRFFDNDIFQQTFTRMVALGYPFLWTLPKQAKDYAIGFVTTVLIGSMSSLAIGAVIITIFMNSKKHVRAILVSLLIVLMFALPAHKTAFKVFRRDITGRINLATRVYKSWDNKLWGDGTNAWWREKHIDRNNKWITDPHNEFLNFLRDWGIVWGGIIIFLFLFPLFYIKGLLLNSYMLFILQCCTDIVLHRTSTMFYSMILIVLAYKGVLNANSQRRHSR